MLKKYLRDLPEPLISDGTPEDPLQKAFLQITIGTKRTLFSNRIFHLHLLAFNDPYLHLNQPPSNAPFAFACFCFTEVEDADDLTTHIQRFNALLKQLPKYRKAVVCDLFQLFACIVAYQKFNLMNAENVATIFGGMTDIMTNLMTGTQRSRLVRVMIENFDVCFDGVYELESRAGEAAPAKETKEGIRVYLHDGTFKSLFCQSSEPGKEILKKAVAKMQQTTTLDEAVCHLYEIRDAMWRLIGDDELVLPVFKSGSALLITDKLKGEQSEKPVAPPAPAFEAPAQTMREAFAARTDSLSSFGGSGTKLTASTSSAGGKAGKKDKKERSPRAGNSSGSSSPAPDGTPGTPTGREPSMSIVSLPAGLGSLVSRDSHGALPKPSPRETNTPPLPFGQPSRMLLWVFPNIPAGSVKATEWDQNATIEGFADLSCSPSGSAIHITTDKLNLDFSPTHMSSVEDSTRYFVMGSGSPALGPRLGLGFETRDEAAKFKSILQQMLQYDQIHAIDAEPSAPLACVLQFASGPLGFDQRLEDGFFETGLISGDTNSRGTASSTSVASLKELAQAPLDVKIPEVVLVNKNQDVRLQRFVQVASKLVPPRASIEERAKILALFVSNVFGGVDISDGVGSIDDGDSPYASLEGISRDSIFSLRSRTKSNIVKIGNITHGVRRHRSILFKYIADRLEPVLPSALARTIPTTNAKAPSYAILVPYPASSNSYAYVDLVNEPGYSYPHESSVTASFANHMQGQLSPCAPGFEHHLSLSHLQARVADLNLASHLTNLPSATQESKTKVFEQIGAAPSGHSRVYRGSIGPVSVAIKDIVVNLVETAAQTDGATPVSALEIAALLTAQIEASKDNKSLVTTFGFSPESDVIRVAQEYLGLGSLEDQTRIARSKAQPFEDDVIMSLILDLANALQSLHAADQVHGNLHPSNILLDGDQVLHRFDILKLADALLTTDRRPLNVSRGVKYRAPEAVASAEGSKAADIWAVGHMIAELVLDESIDSAQLTASLAEAEAEYGIFAPFVTECCNTDAAARISAQQLIEKASTALDAITPRP